MVSFRDHICASTSLWEEKKKRQHLDSAIVHVRSWEFQDNRAFWGGNKITVLIRSGVQSCSKVSI